MHQFIGEPLWLGSAAGVAQEVKHVDQPRTGDNALITDMSMAAGEVAEQLHLQFVARREIGVATLGGEDAISRAVPIHASLAQSGAGGDDSLIALGISFHMVQRHDIFRFQSGNSPGVGFEIVDENGLLQIKLGGETCRLDHPGKVGGFNPPVANRAGNAKAGSIRMQFCSLDELGDDLIQASIFAAGENRCGHQSEVAVRNIEEGQPCIRSSDVACQDHFSKFLQ